MKPKQIWAGRQTCPSCQEVQARTPVAQLAEQRSPKPQVGGSIPSWRASMDQTCQCGLGNGAHEHESGTKFRQ